MSPLNRIPVPADHWMPRQWPRAGMMEVTIEAAGYGQAGGVTETLPDGFTYVSSSLGSSQVNVIDQQRVRFTLQGDTSFTYTVTASSMPGSYQFLGTLRDFDRMDFAVGGDSSVTVEAAAVEPSSAAATRSFSDASVALGGQVVVTIAAANYGQAGGVTETLPAGFTYESSSLGSSQVSVIDQQRVRFTLQGDTSFTYTVTASSMPGSYQFLGTLRDFDRMDFAVGGDSSVTVEAAAVEPSSAVATRSFSDASVALGGQVVVTIAAANYGQAGGVTETLPAGFTYESSDLDTSQVTVTGREVRFTLQGDTSFTYTVAASSAPGSYEFLGTLRDFDRMDFAVGGDSSVTVEAAAVEPSSAVATRSFSEASVALGGEVVVTIAAD